MSKKILLCEDQRDIGLMIEKELEVAGHSVDFAATADQAIELFTASLQIKELYDLIITDVDMAGHTGLYFASHVRAQGYQGRIVVLTNLARDTIIHSVQAVQGEYYLKSNEITELDKIVREMDLPQRRRVGDAR